MIRNFKRILIGTIPLKFAIRTIGETRSVPLIKVLLNYAALILDGDLSTVSPRNASKIEKYQHDLAKYLNVKNTFLVTNGGTAIQIAIRSLNLPKGSKILIQDQTCSAAYQSILASGCIPVIVKRSQQGFGFSISDLKSKLTGDTECIIFTHLGGVREDVNNVMMEIGRYIPTIEDSCLYFGPYASAPETDIQIYSFGFSKPMSAGEGGLISTNKSNLAERISFLRNWGKYPDASDSSLTVPSWNARANLLSAAYTSNQINLYIYKIVIFQKVLRRLEARLDNEKIRIHRTKYGDELLTFATFINQGMDYLKFEELKNAISKSGLGIGSPTFSKALDIPFMQEYLDISSNLEIEEPDGFSNSFTISPRYLNAWFFRKKLIRVLKEFDLVV